jgi:PAS domain S-box-containing protein
MAFSVLPLLLILLLTVPGHAQTEPQNALNVKNVLVLHSEDREHPAHQLTDKGIRSVFRSNTLFDVELYNEYLDVSRFGGAANAHAFADYLRRKYSGMNIHAIIAIYPKAVDFLLAERRTLFPELPIIATEITRSYAENLERSPARRFVTGTILGDNLTGMMDAALRVRPETKRVALVAGTAPTDAHTEEIFRRGFRPYAGKIDLIDLTKLSVGETLSRVVSLPPDTLVFYASIFRDGAGKTFVPREALTLISRATNAPVFSLYDTYLDYGIVGGQLVSLEQQGKGAAALALRIMGGESPACIPFGGEQTYVNLYDWRELKRWNMNESRLPPGSIVINRPVSPWVLYKSYIILSVATVLVLLFTTMTLLLQKHRKEMTDMARKKAEEKYRNIFEGAIEGILETSPQGQPLTVNPALAKMLGYDSPADVLSSIRDTADQMWASPDEHAGYTRQLEKENAVSGFEGQLARKDGTKFWASFSTRRIAELDGRTLFYSSFIEDITARKLAQQFLEEQLKFEALLADLSVRFINLTADQLDAEIVDGQRRICEHLGLDVSWIWRWNSDHSDMLILTSIWLRPNFPMPASMSVNAAERFPWSRKTLLKGEVVRLSRVTDAPAGAARDMQAWQYYGTKSVLIFPLSAGGHEMFGALEFQTLEDEREWSDEVVNGLRLVAEVFANALARMQGEEWIRRSELKYRGLYESMMDGFVLVSLDGVIMEYNDTYLQMTGYAREELLRLTYQDLTPERWHDFEQEIIEQQVLLRGYSEVYEKEYRKKDGTIFPVELRTFLYKGQRANNMEMWAIVRDITNRTEMNMKLQNAVEDWQTTFDSIPDFVTILDRDCRVVRANAAAQPFFDPILEDAIGCCRHVLKIETREPIGGCPVATAQKSKIYAEMEFYDEIRNVWFRVSANPILDGEGEISRVVQTIKDITRQKGAEGEIFAARRTLQHTDRLLHMGELTASLAHELNQPLTSILSNARAALRFIKSDSLDQAELAEILQDIVDDDKRAGNIIRSLRSMVKPEDSERELVDINGIVREVVVIFNSEAIIRRIRVETVLGDLLPYINGDKVQLQQVVVNLMMNAVDSMLKTSKISRIIIRTEPTGNGGVMVSVRDFGLGVDDKELARIFEPFFTTKDTGLGMGLSLSRSIIESHGGHIWAKNNIDGGATFFFNLPALGKG